MKNIGKNVLFVVLITLFIISCKKTNEKNEQLYENNMSDERKAVNIIVEVPINILELLNLRQGYYIQGISRGNNKSRSPEILLLILEGDYLLIREVDYENEKMIIRNEISLIYDGNIFIHNNTSLREQNGELHIIYHEHKPERHWREIWDFDTPYIFAGDLMSPVPNNVKELTTDHFITFTGKYVCDSFEIINANYNADTMIIENAIINVNYNKEKKCLTILADFINNISTNFPYRDINGIETTEDNIFYWFFGEASGFVEIKYYLYKDGITFYGNDAMGHYDYEKEEYFGRNIELRIIFKKEY